MKVVIQRVKSASVSIRGQVHSSIGGGLVVFLGITHGDGSAEVDYLVKKISALRIFDDDNGVMNLDIRQIGGEVLVVSQFTLYAQTARGNRPSYIDAAPSDVAIPLYEEFIEKLERVLDRSISTGVFGADMAVSLVNDGPVTIVI